MKNLPFVRRPRRRPLRRRLPPPPPPPPRRLLGRRQEDSGLDLADLTKYGGAAALGAGATLLFMNRDKILNALRGKEEVSEDDVREAVEEALKAKGESLSEEEKEEIVKKVLEELSKNNESSG